MRRSQKILHVSKTIFKWAVIGSIATFVVTCSYRCSQLPSPVAKHSLGNPVRLKETNKIGVVSKVHCFKGTGQCSYSVIFPPKVKGIKEYLLETVDGEETRYE